MATLHVNDNPFPGIRSYEIHEDELFFGREQQVRELTGKLAETRFLAIVGSSGCGKSSLIKAGLIPALMKNKPENFAKGWKLSVFRPSDDPIGNLAASLAPNVDTARAWATELRTGPEALVNILKRAGDTPDDSRLIIIDQFEELFRFRNSRTLLGTITETTLFVELVLTAIRSAEVPVFIVLSMRTDFLDECTEFRGLSEMINKGYYLVPRMNNEERRLAITGPVRFRKANISDELVDRLLDDVGDDPDQLPIMQHAMMRTWEYWSMNRIGDTPIGLEHYNAIGTMKEALSVHLEEIFADLRDDKNKYIAEKLFKALTDITKESRGTRRPTQLREIMTLAEAREEELVRVIDSFRQSGCAFLMPSAHITIGPESTIDISHESIMRVWTRLRKWVEEESRSAELYLRLSKSAELYQEGKTGLWINPELQLALQWKDQAKPNATWAMRYDPAFDRALTFLQYSKKQHELELQKKEMQQKRNLKRARTSAVVLGIASIVSILFLLISLNLRFKAEASRKEALKKEKEAVFAQKRTEEQRREAILQKKISEQQQQIAEQQKVITEEQRQYAVEQQGIAEVQTRVAVTEKKKADVSKQEALVARDEAQAQRKEAVAQTDIANTERSKAESSEQNARRLRLLAISRSMAIQAGQLFNTVKDDLPALLAVESWRLNNENGGAAADPAIYAALAAVSGDQAILRGHDDGVRAVALTKDGKTLFSCGDDNKLMMWNLSDLQAQPVAVILPKQLQGTLRSLGLTGDGKLLVAGTTAGNLLIWKSSALNEPARIIRAHGGPVAALAMNPAGTTFASAGSDGKLVIWNYSREPFSRQLADSSAAKISCAAFSPDGKTLAWGTASGQVKTVSVPSSSVSSSVLSSPVLQSHVLKTSSPVLSLTYSPDGSWLAAGLNAGSILAWNTAEPDAKPKEILGRHLSGVTALAFSPDSKTIASAAYDKTIRLAGFPDPEANPVAIENHESWVYGTLFTPDGGRLISCSADKTIRIFTTRNETLAGNLRKKLTRNMTPDEWKRQVGSDIPYEKTRDDLPIAVNSNKIPN
jgi:WD40 repeat protein/energy-coupling factor transporter ATP-binding protein EcfA2